MAAGAGSDGASENIRPSLRCLSAAQRLKDRFNNTDEFQNEGGPLFFKKNKQTNKQMAADK